MKTVLRRLDYILTRLLIRFFKWLGLPTITNLDFIVLAIILIINQKRRDSSYFIATWLFYLMFISPLFKELTKNLEGK